MFMQSQIAINTSEKTDMRSQITKHSFESNFFALTLPILPKLLMIVTPTILFAH